MSKIQQQLREERDLAIHQRDAATKELAAERENMKHQIAAIHRAHNEEVRTLKQATHIEQTDRMAAQRGLVPYVRGLEALDMWLRKQPEQREFLRPKLQELGLWEIKLGYDPDKDLGLSAVSPHRV